MTAGAPDPPNVNYLLCEYRKPIKSWRKTWVFVRGWVKSIITSCLCCHNHYGTGLFTVHSVKSNSTDNYELNYEIFKSLRPLVFHLDWWNKVHYVVKLSGSIDNTSQLRAISGSHASIVYKRKVPLGRAWWSFWWSTYNYLTEPRSMNIDVSLNFSKMCLQV